MCKGRRSVKQSKNKRNRNFKRNRILTSKTSNFSALFYYWTLFSLIDSIYTKKKVHSSLSQTINYTTIQIRKIRKKVQSFEIESRKKHVKFKLFEPIFELY